MRWSCQKWKGGCLTSSEWLLNWVIPACFYFQHIWNQFWFLILYFSSFDTRMICHHRWWNVPRRQACHFELLLYVYTCGQGAWEKTLAPNFLAHFQRLMTASIRLTLIGLKPLLMWLTDYSNKSTDWWTVIRCEPWEEDAAKRGLSDLMCYLVLSMTALHWPLWVSPHLTFPWLPRWL